MQTPRTFLTTAAAILLAATTFAGCTAGASGTAALYVKDAPADGLAHLYISFTKAEVHHVEKENKTAEKEDAETDDHDNETNETEKSRDDGQFGPEAEAEEDNGQHDNEDKAEGSWITIMERNVTVDLKAFSGNASAFLDSASIPPGTYNGIRLTVTDAVAVYDNGTQEAVKVPSGSLRIKGHFTVTAGKETALTLDFNLQRSLVETGQGKLILKPVIRLASEVRGEAGNSEREERQARRDEQDRKGEEAIQHG